MYAPLPAASLSVVVRRLRYAVPQWRGELPSALERAPSGSGTRGSVEWDGIGRRMRLSPAEPAGDVVRLLAPLNPVVWDRRRFEMLWGWAYRLKPARRHRPAGSDTALPLLWRDHVVGGPPFGPRPQVDAECLYVVAPPRDRGFSAALDAELERMRVFLHGL